MPSNEIPPLYWVGSGRFVLCNSCRGMINTAAYTAIIPPGESDVPDIVYCDKPDCDKAAVEHCARLNAEMEAG